MGTHEVQITAHNLNMVREKPMRAACLRVCLMAVVALTCVSLTTAWACSCEAPGPPCQNAFRVDAVFAGTVRSITELPDDRPPLRPNEARIPLAVRVDFEMVTAFRGNVAPTLSIVTAGSGPACGYSFKQGERYLVYANTNREGQLVTGICSRTRPITEAAEDLRFLETLSALKANGARVSGTVQHWERDPATREAVDLGPVRDVRIWVRSTGMTVDAFTDGEGRYEVTVPPGKYEITAMPPPEFSQRYLSRSVELRAAGACFVADFGVRFDGRIRGVVRQSTGDPAVGISVQLIAAQDVGKTGYIDTRVEETAANGGFEFLDVSPGRYVVGVDVTRTIEDGVIFPATFHPGTPDPALATHVELIAAQHHELEPMTLPPARRQLRLSGSVLFADGTPAAGASIVLQDGRGTFRQVAWGTATRSDGTFSFVAHEGLSYVVHATYNDDTNRQQLRSSVGPLVVTRDIDDLKVVLSAPAATTPR